jgi:hypothetical protein
MTVFAKHLLDAPDGLSSSLILAPAAAASAAA